MSGALGVGPWFDRLDEWDALAGYSIDRMFRNHYDFVTTWHDVFEPNGKKLIAVSEDIDMTTEAGELSAHMRVLFAQAELRKMRERSRKAKKLITSGYANGGRSSMHWGYMTQKSGDHAILVPDLTWFPSSARPSTTSSPGHLPGRSPSASASTHRPSSVVCGLQS